VGGSVLAKCEAAMIVRVPTFAGRTERNCSMKRKLPDPAYYGEKSRDFWKVINSLPIQHRGTAYALGVALQNAESSLRFLIENEMSNAQMKRKAT